MNCTGMNTAIIAMLSRRPCAGVSDSIGGEAQFDDLAVGRLLILRSAPPLAMPLTLASQY